MNTTTDLKVIRKYPKRFTWGLVTHIIDVGPYTFIRFIPFSSDENETQFHIYVDGHDLGKSSSTLEGAMILAIAMKNLKVSEADVMSRAAAKLLSVDE